jgi:hypothetical protein
MGLAGTAIALIGAGTLLDLSAREQAAQVNVRLADRNAKIAEFRAAGARKRGQENAQLVREARDRVIGAQRAALAGQGLDVAVGTAVDLQEEAARAAEADIVTVLNNAELEAWGIENNLDDIQFQSELARFGLPQAQLATALGGAGRLTQVGLATRRKTTKKKGA